MTTAQNLQANDYAPGDSERELARLERQAVFFSGMTRDVLNRAGLVAGMRVLDLGCGVGDVSLVAADIVGPQGHVLGLDISPAALSVATRRLAAAGHQQVEFEQGMIDAFEHFGDFDAIIGRFILVHLATPAETLRRIVGKARQGAAIAFCELDLGMTATTRPSPLFDRSVRQIIEVFKRTGRQPEMGSELFAAFRAAGLDPALCAFQHVGSFEEDAGFDFLAESVRSMVPAIEKLGIASAADVDIETLKDRLITEAQGSDACIFYPRFVGAWAHT
jgi:SAM-dependent methyltransferase